MNAPTPWPPEVPAGENPPPGAILDYYLASDAAGPVKIEILDAARARGADLLEHRSGARRSPGARPGGVQQDLPGDAERAGLPAAALLAGAADGDLDACGHAPRLVGHALRPDRRAAAAGAAAAAAPARCRTGPIRRSTRRGRRPASYTVRLTVDGKSYTQPITLRLDPRVTTSAVGSGDAVVAHPRDVRRRPRGARRLHAGARASWPQLGALAGEDVAKFKAQVEALAPAAAAGGGGRRGGGAAVRGRARRGRRRASADASERQRGDAVGGDGDAGGGSRANRARSGGVRDARARSRRR